MVAAGSPIASALVVVIGNSNQILFPVLYVGFMSSIQVKENLGRGWAIAHQHLTYLGGCCMTSKLC